MKKDTDKKLIQKFFLGEMDENERIEFEENFLADAELFDEIKAFEDELIEKYVRQRMDSEENTKFEQHFLTTGIRRERVEFARRLIRKLQEDSVIGEKNEESAKISIWDRFGKIFLTPKTAVPAAFAAIFGVWLLIGISETENIEVVKIQNSNIAETPTPTAEITPIKNENSNFESGKNSPFEINNSNNSIKPPAKENSNANPPEPKKNPVEKRAPNPVLTLFAGTLRSEGKSYELNLPENASGATFRLNLESVDYKTFQAELTDAEGRVIFRRADLKPQRSLLNLFIPGKNLKKGDYVIKLSGKNETGENESVADFQFRVN